MLRTASICCSQHGFLLGFMQKKLKISQKVLEFHCGEEANQYEKHGDDHADDTLDAETENACQRNETAYPPGTKPGGKKYQFV